MSDTKDDPSVDDPKAMVREKRRLYQREYYEKNREKRRLYQRGYYEKNPDQWEKHKKKELERYYRKAAERKAVAAAKAEKKAEKYDALVNKVKEAKRRVEKELLDRVRTAVYGNEQVQVIKKLASYHHREELNEALETIANSRLQLNRIERWLRREIHEINRCEK